MKIFPNSISICIPEPYTLYKSVTQGIIGKGKRKVKGDHSRNMDQTMHCVINSIEYRYLKMISCIYLRHTEHRIWEMMRLLSQIILHFHEVLLRSPRVSINYSDHNVLFIYHQSLKIVKHMLNCPRNIWCFSFGFSLSYLMFGEANISK